MFQTFNALVFNYSDIVSSAYACKRLALTNSDDDYCQLDFLLLRPLWAIILSLYFPSIQVEEAHTRGC